MVETHAITRADAEKAKATPLKLAPPNVEASDAPYFVDLVRDTLISKFDERQMNDQCYRIYTTLDPDLQKAAAQRCETGIKLVDDQVTKLRTKRDEDRQEQVRDQGPARTAGPGGAGGDGSAHRRSSGPGGRTQLWLQPVEPRGGEASHGIDLQALRLRRGHEHGAGRRQPGVHARRRWSHDAPSTFAYGDQIYEPRNYKEEYHGDVTRAMRWPCR